MEACVRREGWVDGLVTEVTCISQHIMISEFQSFTCGFSLLCIGLVFGECERCRSKWGRSQVEGGRPALYSHSSFS